MQENIKTYHEHLGIPQTINAIEYRKRFKGLIRNSDGVPLHLEEQAARRGLAFAEAYERLYDLRKSEMKAAGFTLFQTVRNDEGGIVALNFPALVTVPAFVMFLEMADNPLWSVVGLHWILSDETYEWVFSHLCEATFAYYSVEDIREQLGDAGKEAYSDVKMYLSEVIYQFDHRHC